MKPNPRVHLNETQMRALRGGDFALGELARPRLAAALIDGSRTFDRLNYLGNEATLQEAQQSMDPTLSHLPNTGPLPIPVV